MPRDYLYGDDFDLVIENGDFKKGESTKQHQQDLLIAHKGEFRLSPLVGAGISDSLNDNGFGENLQEVQRQFEMDGMTIEQIRVDGQELEVKAEYR
jgi:hypothetical protein